MKNKKIIKISAAALAVIIFILAFGFLNRLFTPKYMSGALDGAFIAEYYEETTPNDVIFLGDCEVFSNISPVYLYENYGITSFVRGSAQQLVWQSYYLLEEMLDCETPKAVVFNVLALKYNEPQNEAYNRITIDGMKMSSHKLGIISASMTEDEQLLDYVFPVLRFHSRWKELSSDDFKYLYKKDKVTHNGYYMRVDVKPVTTLPTVREEADYSFGDTAWEYMEKIRLACEREGVELILMKAPSLIPHWYDEYEAQIVEYAEKHGLNYINVLAAKDEIGIDYTADTFDAGMHMNLYGAEKVTKYIGGILDETLDLPDRREDEKIADVWAEKIEFYYGMIEAQKKELAENGRLLGFGAVAK